MTVSIDYNRIDYNIASLYPEFVKGFILKSASV